MGSGDILSHINEFFSQLNKYFNPVGKFYIKVQVLCRVLVCSVFLDDLFKSNGLECDTKQVGCEQNCVNRFAPINHKKLWELELFTVLLATIIFIGFNLWNEHMIKQQEKKRGEVTQDWMARKSMTRKVRKDKVFYKSPVTNFGYVLMLVVRLTFEIVFCWVENNLGKHQSQNTDFWQRFWLKESWMCATNTPNRPELESLDRVLPESNRSSIFWTDDHNLACLQQKITVTCWIPFSRMRSFGLLFMYWVLLVNTVLTACELIYEICRICSSSSKKQQLTIMRQQNSQPAPIINGQAEEIIHLSPEADYSNVETLKAPLPASDAVVFDVKDPGIYPNVEGEKKVELS